MSCIVNGRKIKQDEEKAQVLNNKQFYANFNHSLPPLDPDIPFFFFLNNQQETYLRTYAAHAEYEVFNLLSNLDTTKSNDPDGISTKMLKATAETITPSITVTMLYR